MIQLREYQQRALDELYQWLGSNDGNPCVVLPTGAGKSVIIAALVREYVEAHPTVRFLVLTHSRELISQNADRLRQLWPEAPLGVYSAGLGSRDIAQVTFAGIQSVHTRAAELGHIDAVLIDEAHLLSPDDGTMYQRLMSGLREVNPHMRLIGLTATPWRLGHGSIADGKLFDAVLESVFIEELVRLGHLTPLRSKLPPVVLDVSSVAIRGGEYVERELQAAVDTESNNESVAREIVARGGDRRHWLIFCAGVEHALNVRTALALLGVAAAVVTGDMSNDSRDEVLGMFRAGEIRAICNVNVLSTGFDFPAIDLIAMLRPTESPVLYMQQAGRGMRPSPGKVDCLLLDFAGNVSRHGPIVAIIPPTKERRSKGEGESPVKLCDQCSELLPASAAECSCCGFIFPAPEKPKLTRHDDDIMGEPEECAIGEWLWQKHLKKETGEEMLRVTCYPELAGVRPLSQWLGVKREGGWGNRCRRDVSTYGRKLGLRIDHAMSVDHLAEELNRGQAPSHVRYRVKGKWPEIVSLEWREPIAPPIVREERESEDEKPTDFDDVFGIDDIPF